MKRNILFVFKKSKNERKKKSIKIILYLKLYIMR